MGVDSPGLFRRVIKGQTSLLGTGTDFDEFLCWRNSWRHRNDLNNYCGIWIPLAVFDFKRIAKQKAD